VKRAGLEAWPRLFHNLQSSRETELLGEFPVHVVALWMGHDAKVSLKHYAQTTDEHFERATRAAESDAPALQKAAQQAAVGNGEDSQTDNVTGDGVATCATPCDSSWRNAHTFRGEGGGAIELLHSILQTFYFQRFASIVTSVVLSEKLGKSDKSLTKNPTNSPAPGLSPGGKTKNMASPARAASPEVGLNT
jgi:hypothetical protein